MTFTPYGPVQISPSTLLEMAEGLLNTLDTVIKHLPEKELRDMRDKLEVSLYTADDHLIGMALSSGVDTLSINGAYASHSCVSTVPSSHTAVTADAPTPPLSPASESADYDVVAQPALSSDDEVPAPPPKFSMIISSRPNVGQPDYKLHPPFVRPGIPGPYVRPPIDPSKGDPGAYHIITKGLYVGIFTSWIHCSPWVTKVAGNTHFKASNWAEAMELYNSCLEIGACEVLS